MIPKIIHYCWLSDDPLPDNIRLCIDSWNKHLPDYEIVKWDRKRMPVESVPWMRDAFNQKKYAFAADYVRAYALLHHGGIYLDSDVELLRSFNPLIRLPYFFGMERFDSSGVIEAAVMGSEPGNPIFQRMLQWYDCHDFNTVYGSDCFTCPKVLRAAIGKEVTIKRIDSIEEFQPQSQFLNVFPAAWFSPKDLRIGKIRKTPTTFCIHHFAGSWREQPRSLGHRLHALLGDTVYYNLVARPYFALKDFLSRKNDF